MQPFNTDILGPIGRLFSLELEGYDHIQRQAQLRFVVGPHWCNGAGHIQGGALSVMLDLSCTCAALFSSEFKLAMPTLEIKTSFLAAGIPGTLYGYGSVIRPGKRCYFLEGRLVDIAGKVMATATATALPTSRE